MEVVSFYKMHKHEVDFILSDNEFGPLKKRLRKEAGVELNLSSPNEHVPEVERDIRLKKERLRSMLAGMPYSKIPTNFKRELILTCASMLNVVPREAIVSDTLSPMELLTGRGLDYKKTLCACTWDVLFGTRGAPVKEFHERTCDGSHCHWPNSKSARSIPLSFAQIGTYHHQERLDSDATTT